MKEGWSTVEILSSNRTYHGGTIVAMKRDRFTLWWAIDTHLVSTRDLRAKATESMALKKLRAFSISLLLVTTVVSGAQTVSQQQIRLHYQRAEEALKANHSQEASNEFREILRLDPRNAEACANLGQIAYSQQGYAEAAKWFAESLTIKPQLWDAKAFLGLSDMMLGRTTDGDPLLLEAFPHITNENLKMQVGVSLVRFHMSTHSLNQVVGVVHELEQSAQADPEVLYVAYRAYSSLAAESLSSLYKRWPESARVHQIFAQSAVTQDDFPGAIKQYKLAIEADPRLPGIHYELGRTILTNSQDSTALSTAEQEFKTELTSNPWDADSEYELGEAYRLETKLEPAEEHYRRSIQINPNLGAAQTALGDLLFSKGKPEDALPHLEAGVRLDADDETAHYKLSRVYGAIGRQDDAKRELALFLKLREEHASSHPATPPDGGGNPIK
jgi:tetratricopeptide (TPR) repeat protein